jgi:hypothetical protein
MVIGSVLLEIQFSEPVASTPAAYADWLLMVGPAVAGDLSCKCRRLRFLGSPERASLHNDVRNVDFTLLIAGRAVAEQGW